MKKTNFGIDFGTTNSLATAIIGERALPLVDQNIRRIMNELWPDLDSTQMYRKLWITESRLCSVGNEIGEVKGGDKRICVRDYLKPQVDLLPNATVVLFGGKAANRCGKLLPNAIKASALSPPGCNFEQARPSWDAAIRAIIERRG